MSGEEDGFDALERDLTKAAGLMPHKAAQAVQQTGMRTKTKWKQMARGNPLGSQYTATIDYTVREYGAFGHGVIEAEIGPDLARYGGKTGRGGLVPSAGIFDDPESTPVGAKPDRSRRRAETFAEEEIDKGVEIALSQSLAEANLGSIGGAAAAILRGSA